MPKRLPDFLIAGVPRSGIRWLCRLLDRHPQIYMAMPLLTHCETRFLGSTVAMAAYRRFLDHVSCSYRYILEQTRRDVEPGL